MGTSSFTAQALVPSNCTISASPLAFGGYDPIGANRTTNLDTTGSITVTCVKGTAPNIALGAALIVVVAMIVGGIPALQARRLTITQALGRG